MRNAKYKHPSRAALLNQAGGKGGVLSIFSLFFMVSHTNYHEGTFCCITNMCHSKTPIKPIDCRHRGGAVTRYLFQNTFWWSWSESPFSERWLLVKYQEIPFFFFLPAAKRQVKCWRGLLFFFRRRLSKKGIYCFFAFWFTVASLLVLFLGILILTIISH